MILRGTTHNHNIYSNFMGSSRFPFDSNIGIVDELMAAYVNGIDFIIQTNHNTVNGYKQTIEHQKNNRDSPLSRVKKFVGQETSVRNRDGKEGHVLSYGTSETIKRGLTVLELKDVVRSQDGITCGAHPYAFGPRLDEEALECDLIEGHNSNNVDIYSNMLALELADKNGKLVMAGGDVHVVSEMPNSTVLVEIPDKNKEDVDIYDITKAFRKGSFQIERAYHNNFVDFKNHVSFQLEYPDALIKNIEESNSPWKVRIAKHFIDRYKENPDSWFVKPGCKNLLKGSRNISKKIAEGWDKSLAYATFKDRIKEYMTPPFLGRRLSKYAKNREIRDIDEQVERYGIDTSLKTFWDSSRDMSAGERLYVNSMNRINSKISGSIAKEALVSY